MKGWSNNPLLVSALGAALAVFVGLLLWATPLGDSWSNASYDCLFRFGSRSVTNQVALVLMDNAAYKAFGQARGQPWDRGIHAQLLNRLADDGCPLVVFDSIFQVPRDPQKDQALTAAMRRQKHVALMAKNGEETHQTGSARLVVDTAQPTLPAGMFLQASGTNWGVAWFDADPDGIVRRQWPFPSPEAYPSLPWTVAQLAGKKLSDHPRERWLRYYGSQGPWTRISYQYALTQPANYFRDKIVFIGNWPETSTPNSETDKFSTPYTRWDGDATGGVELLLTSFLNLVNDDSLLRPPQWVELLLFVASGVVLGGTLCRLKFSRALAMAAGLVIVISLFAILLSYFSNYWFPWLIIVGGQVPCALVWALIPRTRSVPEPTRTGAREAAPNTPGYELVHPSIGEGAYGRVWLARNKAGHWRALKVIYLAKFEDNPGPYEREYNGVKKYQPISDQHPGLLRVDFVSEKHPGYFYYVMELGDSLAPGWEKNPSSYKPRDLVTERLQLPKRRLPIKECFRVGIALSEALEFMHGRGMTHRDIKPQNIIYVNGQPKFADLGLITDIRPDDQERTLVGTPGYMPPSPERPGTVAADIYALGMVLYVLSTGRAAALFPEIATTLVNPDADEPPNFLPLNNVILKACEPRPADRFASAREMRVALEEALKLIATNGG